MDAAIACLQRYGLEKTGMSDIAAAAGVTKPTIYTYFASRDELLHSALDRAGRALGERLIANSRDFSTPAEQVVEAVLFALREIPNEPGLAVTSASEADGFGSRAALRPASLAIARQVLGELFTDRPDLLEDVDEIPALEDIVDGTNASPVVFRSSHTSSGPSTSSIAASSATALSVSESTEPRPVR